MTFLSCSDSEEAQNVDNNYCASYPFSSNFIFWYFGVSRLVEFVQFHIYYKTLLPNSSW